MVPYGDFRLNVTNSHSRDALAQLSVERLVLSPELTLPKARDIGGAVIVYGRIPLMLTERCFIKENFGCDKCTVAALTDRRGEKFPIMREYSHRNLILNSRHTYMGDRRAELDACGLRSVHFIFTTESPAEIFAATDAFRKGRALHGVDVRRVGRRKNTKK
jgi:putative protease